ncbi:MAG: GNAT family N-acetyltransferase [Propionibacteriaceae bacterium]|nr:GNAT family N-acetyltransferase [Propionibacteriaceae bacterium]
MRPAHARDLDAILALEAAGFGPRERWSRASWASELEADNRIVVVAGEVAGIASVQHVGGVAELNRIIVSQAARRCGLGRALLRAGIDAALELECEEMLLEVRHDNAAALALYAGHGFVEIARRNNYYGEGIDAVILRLGLEDDDD